MKKHILTVIAAIAAPFVSLAASPAATQAWVTNYVNEAIEHIGDSDIPTNAVAGTIDVAASTLTFNKDGQTYTYQISVTYEAANQFAYCVYSSDDPERMPTNTIFALDETTGRYVNRTRDFPNDMTLVVSNGCSHLSQSNGVWVAESSGATNLAFVAVASNGVFQYSFQASKIVVTRGEAMSVGVTNAVVSTAAFRRNALEILSDVIFPTAFADGETSSDRSASFGYVIEFLEIDKSSTVTFEYCGDITYWKPGEGFEYSPDWWPTKDDWYNEDNWAAETQNAKGKICVTSYIYEGGEYKPVDVYVSKAKLIQLGGKSISSCIPTYKEPDKISKLTPADECNRGNHYYVRCVCKYCGKMRKHDLQYRGNGKCYRCDNRNGYVNSPLVETCDSTCSIGTIRSDTSNHFGWQDCDDKDYNMMACACECYRNGKDENGQIGWKLVHKPGGEKKDIGEGMRGDDGQIVSGTEDDYHHYSLECQRVTNDDGDVCGAPVNYNEAHDFRSASGELPCPFIGSKDDPENIVYLTYGSQDEEANDQYHYVDDMTCTVCGRESDGFLAHSFASGACACLQCGLYVHSDESYTCGTRTVPGCPRCNTYDPSGKNRRKEGRVSNLLEKLHDISFNDNIHWCSCGRISKPHSLYRKGNNVLCAYCGYSRQECDGDEDLPDAPPVQENYVIGGYCGNWQMRSGDIEKGGNLYAAPGLMLFFPREHSLSFVTNYLCKQCVNINPLTEEVCGRCDISGAASEHGGWHDGTNHMCVCQCGMAEQEHNTQPTNYIYDADNICKSVGVCINIGGSEEDRMCGAIVTNDSSHAFHDSTNDVPYYVDITNHTFVICCEHDDAPGCGLVTNRLESHNWVEIDGPIPAENPTNHVYIDFCSTCESTNLVGEAHEFVTNFVYKNEDVHNINGTCFCTFQKTLGEAAHSTLLIYKTHYESITSDMHKVQNWCVDCTNYYGVGKEWCIWDYDNASLGTWEGGTDTFHCAKSADGCTNLHAVAHVVCWNSTLHWCAYASGKRHLLGAHRFVNDYCQDCGYHRGDPSRGAEREIVTYVCEHCANFEDCCSATYYVTLIDGVVESSEMISTTCDNWDGANLRCGCVSCSLGLAGWGCCNCGVAKLIWGPHLGPILGSNSK